MGIGFDNSFIIIVMFAACVFCVVSHFANINASNSSKLRNERENGGKKLALVYGRVIPCQLDKSMSPWVANLHINSKFRVFATEAFRSEKSTETSDNSTEISGEINETFESVSISPKFCFW
jgi:hypothetical protein